MRDIFAARGWMRSPPGAKMVHDKRVSGSFIGRWLGTDLHELHRGADGRHHYLMIIIDHFSRYAKGYDFWDKKSETTGKYLQEYFETVYEPRFGKGVRPEIFETDNGGEFRKDFDMIL
jgi:hypothetical protein